jgi:hypothetical protein
MNRCACCNSIFLFGEPTELSSLDKKRLCVFCLKDEDRQIAEGMNDAVIRFVNNESCIVNVKET